MMEQQCVSPTVKVFEILCAGVAMLCKVTELLEPKSVARYAAMQLDRSCPKDIKCPNCILGHS